MKDKQDWLGAYIELGELILDPDHGIPEIKHVDLWHGQIEHEALEYPWPPGSLFLEFQAVSLETTGLKVQDMNMHITAYYVLDTLSESHINSDTRAIALEFGNNLRKIHKLLQGRYGVNFGELNRVGFGSVPAPQYLIAYRQTYSCIIRDESAMDEPGEVTIKKATITPGTSNSPGSDTPLYTVQL